MRAVTTDRVAGARCALYGAFHLASSTVVVVHLETVEAPRPPRGPSRMGAKTRRGDARGTPIAQARRFGVTPLPFASSTPRFDGKG